jgi:hypothetical protein
MSKRDGIDRRSAAHELQQEPNYWVLQDWIFSARWPARSGAARRSCCPDQQASRLAYSSTAAFV